MHDSKAVVMEPITLAKNSNIYVYKITTSITISKTNNPVKNLSSNFSKENSLKILQIRLFKFILKSLLKLYYIKK